MPIHTKPLIDYASFTSADHVSWKLHRKAGLLVRPDLAESRHCIGLGLVVDATTDDSWVHRGNAVLLPDKCLRWATIVDVPGRAFVARSRTVSHHLATVRPTTIQFGSPRLTRHSEGPPCWDFREFPFDDAPAKRGNKTVTIRRRDTTLSPREYPQLFRLFNAMEWAMTSTAFATLPGWARKQEEFYKLIKLSPAPGDRGVFLFGEGFNLVGEEPKAASDIPHPETWMPEPYVAYREQDVPYLFDVITSRPLNPDEDFQIPVGLRDAFLDALGDNLAYHAKFDGRVEKVEVKSFYDFKPGNVRTLLAYHEVTLSGDCGEHEVIRVGYGTNKVMLKDKTFKAGDLIVEDHIFNVGDREAWKTMWAGDRWTLALAGIPYDHLIPHIRMWFERQGVHIMPGTVHFPHRIAHAAAYRGAVDRDLMWDVRQATQYFRNDCECFVFPPILIDNWDDFSGTLPGDVPYDFAPTDLRVRFSREG